MTNKVEGDIEYHKRAWSCPFCHRWNRVRHSYDNKPKKRKCRCGKGSAIIKTALVQHTCYEVEIDTLEEA